MRAGVKRSFVSMMLIAVPLVSAEPISLLQETTLLPPAIEISAAKPALQKPELPKPIAKKPVFFGVASWYSESDPAINLHTANGEIFDDSKMACASWQFPFGTRLKVTNLKNGKSIICVVNDRGPAKRLGRIIDLTVGAFRKIADPTDGLIRVSVSKVSK